jgi:hypothetical protein
MAARQALVLGLAVLLGNWYQSKMEHQRWIRDKKADAYSAALRGLYRLTNRRSYLLADGRAVLAREHQKDWFDDYIALEEALGTLAIYARDEFVKSLLGHARTLRSEFETVMAGTTGISPILDLRQFRALTETFEDELIRASVHDLRLTVAPVRR